MSPSHRSSRWPLYICLMLLALFASLAWMEIRGRCATYDETVHAPASWLVRYRRDFRLNPEDPPLWQYWAALAQPADALPADAHPALWQKVLNNTGYQGDWCAATMYQTPGFDADQFLNRARIMMLALAVAAAALCAIWARRIAGPVAAVVATVLFCFDPNFLAHGPLVKNDVAITLAMLATLYATWQLGRRVTVIGILGVGLSLGAALSTKYSALMLMPIVALLLIGRAISPGEWDMPGRTLDRGPDKLRAILVVGVMAGLVAAGVVWASYAFRYRPADEVSANMQTPAMLQYTARAQWDQAHPDGSRPTADYYEHWQPTGLIRVVLVARQMHLMPEAWLHGLVEMLTASSERNSYLDRQFSRTGFRSYFPLAMLYKTPIATLIAAGLALIVGLRALIMRQTLTVIHPAPSSHWTLSCLLVPIGIYGAAAVSAHLDIGLRHVLPLYPLFFILIAWTGASVWNSRSKVGRAAMIALALGLAMESIAAFPNHIAFFNIAAGSSTGGLCHLGDSNLDWGQDLKALVNWQNAHPDTEIYLCYFGSASPKYYGLRYTPLVGTSTAKDKAFVAPFPPSSADHSAIVAISATHLQGIYLSPEIRTEYLPLQTQKPFAILGGTIYLYKIEGAAQPVPLAH